MKQYLIIHMHGYGYETYRAQANRWLDQDDVEQIVKVMGIDFEPTKGETLEIIVLSEYDEVFTIE